MKEMDGVVVLTILDKVGQYLVNKAREFTIDRIFQEDGWLKIDVDEKGDKYRLLAKYVPFDEKGVDLHDLKEIGLIIRNADGKDVLMDSLKDDVLTITDVITLKIGSSSRVKEAVGLYGKMQEYGYKAADAIDKMSELWEQIQFNDLEVDLLSDNYPCRQSFDEFASEFRYWVENIADDNEINTHEKGGHIW